MVRPFFKWIVSANAAAEASIIHIASRVVTRSRIEAHSSNSERTYLRNESTGKPEQIRPCAGRMQGVLVSPAGLGRARDSRSDISCPPARTGGVPLRSTE